MLLQRAVVVDEQHLAEQLRRRAVQDPEHVAEQRGEGLVVEDDDHRCFRHLRAPRPVAGPAGSVPQVLGLPRQQDVVADVEVEAVLAEDLAVAPQGL